MHVCISVDEKKKLSGVRGKKKKTKQRTVSFGDNRRRGQERYFNFYRVDGISCTSVAQTPGAISSG